MSRRTSSLIGSKAGNRCANESGPKRSPAGTRRLAKASAGALALAVGVVVGVLYFGAKKPPAAMAEVDNCPLPTPEPGPARPWENEIAVSPYSRVNTRTRNLFTAIPLARVPMNGPDADIVLYHNSGNVGYDEAQVPAPTPLPLQAPPTTNMRFSLGSGWTTAHSDQLVFGPYDNPITAMYSDGTRVAFTWDGSIYAPPPGVHDRLIEVDSVTWHVVHKDQSYHEFVVQNDAVRLQAYCDHAGGCGRPAYEDLDPDPDPAAYQFRFESVGGIGLDMTGKVKFHYDGSGMLVRIEDQHAGGLEPGSSDIIDQTRDWNLSYRLYSWTVQTAEGPEERTQDRLCQIENPNGYFMYFWYDSEGRITAMTDFRTPLPTFPVNESPCVTGALPAPPWDAYRFGYDPYVPEVDAGGRIVTVTDPDDPNDPDDGMTQYFDGICGNLKIETTYTDRRGSEWEYLYDGSQFGLFPDANLIRTKSPIVDAYTTRVFDDERNVLSIRDAVDKIWTATYDGNGNRLTWTDPLYHVQTWEYDALNNMTAYEDAVGNRTEYHYDLLVLPDPYTPTHHSALLTRIVEPSTHDPEPPYPSSGTATTTLAYYNGGNLRSVTDPLGVVTRFEYDIWGQMTYYYEGEIPGQTPGVGVPVRSSHTESDSAGRLVNAGAGTNHHDPGGNQTGSSCAAALNSVESGDPWPDGWPTLPGTLAFNRVEGSYAAATFSPKGEVLGLPMQLDLTGSGSVSRSFTNGFDALGRIKSRIQNEGSINRAFDYKYEIPSGLTYRCGSDPVSAGVAAGQLQCTGSGATSESVWLRDEAGRVAQFWRGPATNPVMSASYTYYDPLDLVRTVTYGNDASVEYEYDDADRISGITHYSGSGFPVLRLVYSWTDNDLPESITEYRNNGVTPIVLATTTFSYDERKRLVREVRTGQNAYDLTYGYDQNGNRTKKIQADIGGGGFVGGRRYEYQYDLEDPSLYGSKNNRLEYVDTIDTTGGGFVPLSRTWYYYRKNNPLDLRTGNVEYIVTGPPQGGSSYMMSGPSGGGGESSLEEAEPLNEIEGEGLVEGEMELNSAGGGSMALMGGYCSALKKEFKAVRFEYAKNGEAVSYILGEHWCSNLTGTVAPTKYEVLWAREFRYDGSRQRYLNRELSAAALNTTPPAITPLSITRSDYDGDGVYADWSEPIPGSTDSPVLLRSFEPGIGRVEPWTDAGGANTAYYHTDMLGTTRMLTGADGNPLPEYGSLSDPTPTTFTAFGERVSGPIDGASNRYGYVGEHGYQAHTEMSFLHLGARYYDPSLGRFLQRDPIGIGGGGNVYGYAHNAPTVGIDPTGNYDGSGIEVLTGFDTIDAHDGGKGPGEIMQQVYGEGRRKGKSDKWMHFVVSCTATSEGIGGFLYVLPGGFLKEVYDNFGGSAGGWLDSLGDMLHNAAGWALGPGAAVSGTSCEQLADKLGIR